MRGATADVRTREEAVGDVTRVPRLAAGAGQAGGACGETGPADRRADARLGERLGGGSLSSAGIALWFVPPSSHGDLDNRLARFYQFLREELLRALGEIDSHRGVTMQPPDDVPWANMSQATVRALVDFWEELEASEQIDKRGMTVPEPLPGAGKLYQDLTDEEIEAFEKLEAALRAWQEYAENS
jgi:hypothetical protein